MALTATPPTSSSWGRWPHQHQPNDYVMMDTAMMPYDSRPATTAPLQRPVMAPQYVNYSMPPHMGSMAAPHYQQHNPFAYNNNFTAGSPPTMVSPYKPQFNRPNLRIVAPDSDGPRDLAYARDRPCESSQSPSVNSVKSEPRSAKSTTPNPSLIAKTITSNIPIGPGAQADFHTAVDTLMKAIQSKTETDQIVKKAEDEVKVQMSPQMPKAPEVGLNASSPQQQGNGGLTASSPQHADHPPKPKKRYLCDITGCEKSFSQKTHLEIHKRAHTGDKPYTCKAPGCGQRFSQLGNLKTHERRHTGEKPYQCEQCGKRFAQRGNVRAHKIVHLQAKPYICKLDKCGKEFTQLGNLKSHQNKFHSETLKTLTSKFAQLKEGDDVTIADREIWEYFATLYKNSNKGIKGRGPNRKVGTVATSTSPQQTIPSHYPVSHSPISHSPMSHSPISHSPIPHSLPPAPQHTPLPGLNHPSSLAAYSMSRGPPPPIMGSYTQPSEHNDRYGMVDFETGSHGTASTTGTMYEEDPHTRELAFGDRMY